MSKFIIAASLLGSALLSTVAITPALAQTIPHWQYDCYVSSGKQPPTGGRSTAGPVRCRDRCDPCEGGGESPSNLSGTSGAIAADSVRCDCVRPTRHLCT